MRLLKRGKGSRKRKKEILENPGNNPFTIDIDNSLKDIIQQRTLAGSIFKASWVRIKQYSGISPRVCSFLARRRIALLLSLYQIFIQ